VSHRPQSGRSGNVPPRFGANIAFMDVQIASGGKERVESVANALAMLKPEVDFVAIHDAVRPCITDELIDAVFARAQQTGAALLAAPVAETLKRVDGQQRVQATVPRQGLWLAQTRRFFAATGSKRRTPARQGRSADYRRAQLSKQPAIQ